MGAGRTPGPECVTKGDRWINDGTSCSQESPRPGSIGIQVGDFLPHISRLRELAGNWFNAAGGWTSETANTVSGHSKSVLLSLIEVLPLKQSSPFSTALLKHYVERSGTVYRLENVPTEWQDWIVKATGGRPGKHQELNPYNSGLYDLRNSLGHFDVEVKVNGDKTKTFEISDDYQFGYIKNDKYQKGRHGFPLGNLSAWELAAARKLLPKGEYHNRGGFKEKWEIRATGAETILFIPQQYLEQQGKSFPVVGTFIR